MHPALSDAVVLTVTANAWLSGRIVRTSEPGPYAEGSHYDFFDDGPSEPPNPLAAWLKELRPGSRVVLGLPHGRPSLKDYRTTRSPAMVEGDTSSGQHQWSNDTQLHVPPNTVVRMRGWHRPLMPVHLKQSSEVREAQAEFAEALSAMIEFCGRRLPEWRPWFQKPVDILAGREVDPDRWSTRFPPNVLPAQASQLLAACSASWLFQGMGSFSDNFYDADIQPDADRLGLQVFRAIFDAAAAAANASGGAIVDPT